MTVATTKGRNDLDCVRLAHRSGSSAEVYLNGGHVTSWMAGGVQRLFLASGARFEKGESIRGGIPVVFPQFADLGPLPQHGFARKSRWEFAGGDETDETARAVFQLCDSAVTREIWPHEFRLLLTVTLGAATLAVELGVENTGTEAFDFTCALHTYFRVSDLSASLVGLHGCEYIDKTRGHQRVRDTARVLTVTEETDRVYLDAPRTIELRDTGLGSPTIIAAKGFSDAVVWNPWKDKVVTVSGMAADDYSRMICVEAAQVGTPVSLPPGGAWTGSQTLTAGER